MNGKMDETRHFQLPTEEPESAAEIIEVVYQALKAKGHDPIMQLVGYIISGDPTYITSYNNARALIRRLERDETMVVLSRGGFVKRMPPKSYVRAAASDDAAELPFAVVPAMTDEKLLFFTDLGNCYPVLAAQIPEGKPRDRGITAGGLLAGLDHGERVVALLNAGDWSGELVLATEGGLIKRTDLSEFNVRKSKFAAVNLKNGDRLAAAVRRGPRLGGSGGAGTDRGHDSPRKDKVTENTSPA